MKNSYPILFSELERQRLKQQSNDLTDDYLSRLGKISNKCLEIGCGIGSNIPVIKKESNDSDYLGIDISEKAINTASEMYGNDKNKFIVGNVFDLELEPVFDLIVIRLVLWSTGDREKIVKQAKKLLKKGGALYCFEPDDSYLVTFPRKKHFEYVVNKWRELVAKDGCNPFIGRELNSLLVTSGFEKITSKLVMKNYGADNPDRYLRALDNLWRIFSSLGYEKMQIQKDIWESAREEVKSVSAQDYLSEGYIVCIGIKV